MSAVLTDRQTERYRQQSRGRDFLSRLPDNKSACSSECFHLSVHPYMKEIRHAPPQLPISLTWMLTHPASFPPAIPHIVGLDRCPRTGDLPGDRWRGHMEMAVHRPLSRSCSHTRHTLIRFITYNIDMRLECKVLSSCAVKL